MSAQDDKVSRKAAAIVTLILATPLLSGAAFAAAHGPPAYLPGLLVGIFASIIFIVMAVTS